MALNIIKDTPSKPYLYTPTIVIAHSDPWQIQLVDLALSFKNLEIISFNNGLKTLKHLQTYTPDLIIIDKDLPGINGFNICKKVKQMSRFHHIPVMLLADKNSEDLRKLSSEFKVDICLSSSLEHDLLRQTIEWLLKLKQHSSLAA